MQKYNFVGLSYFFKRTLLLVSLTIFAGFASAQDSLSIPIVEIATTDTFAVKDHTLFNDDNGIYFKVDQKGIAQYFTGEEPSYITTKDSKAYLDLEYDENGALVFFRKNGPESQYKLYHISKKSNGLARTKKIPLWMSLLPPLIAIILALIFKEVIISLFMGIWAGAFIAGGLRLDSPIRFIKSLLATVQEYVIGALDDSGHMSVIIFSLLIGGMVAIISKNGGMAGVVKSLSKYARDPVSTQFITWLLGIAIFFDDYANTLIVGNTMRSVTDKFKVSREKLAYIVDSTAAPVSAIAFITTWIGAELGYIDDGMAKIGLETDMTAYSIFLSSLKYSFYPILTLIFLLIIIYSKRDFGPMWKAEHRARTTGQVSSAKTESDDEPNMEDLTPVSGAPLKWQYAVFPVLTVILMTIYGLVDTGFSSIYSDMTGVSNEWSQIWSQMGQVLPDENAGFFTKLGKLIGSSDSYIALLWASMSGVVLAIIMTVAGKVMKLFDTMHWMVMGFKTMLPALIILTLAWSLAITTDQLHTADYLSNAIQGNISPYYIPALIFVLAAFIAFSTGSSWSTMAILYPIAIPTSFAVCQAAGLDPNASMEILLNVIATVLAASVLGDHCSPISDTTILSSLASDCNHIDHVRTQLPYALTVGIASIICVTISAFAGGGILVSLILIIVSVALLTLFVRKFGKKIA